MSRSGRLPAPPVASSDPLLGDLPRMTTAAALAERLTGHHVDLAVQLQSIICTGWVGHVIDTLPDGRQRVLGSPRGGAGGFIVVDAEALRRWSTTALPSWRRIDDLAVWQRVADLHLAWVREQTATRDAAVSEPNRAAARLAEQRQRDQRRAELRRELGELDGPADPTEQPNPASEPVGQLDAAPSAPPRPGSWLRSRSSSTARP